MTKKIPTISFSKWLNQTLKALKTDGTAVVPCGDCRGCCTSSFFIHIRPEEKKTLAVIPKKLLFSAPGLPKGHVLLGYSENGHCPLFKNNVCSIYENRPITCRQFDCRIFPATGIKAENEKPRIKIQSERWKFTIASEQDHKKIKAVQAAAKFLNRNSKHFPENFIPKNPTQQAILAIKIYRAFLPK